MAILFPVLGSYVGTVLYHGGQTDITSHFFFSSQPGDPNNSITVSILYFIDWVRHCLATGNKQVLVTWKLQNDFLKLAVWEHLYDFVSVCTAMVDHTFLLLLAWTRFQDIKRVGFSALIQVSTDNLELDFSRMARIVVVFYKLWTSLVLIFLAYRETNRFDCNKFKAWLHSKCTRFKNVVYRMFGWNLTF